MSGDYPVSTAPSILPARSPPLFPLVAIKAVFPQLHIDRIMRLTHPFSKLVPVAHARFIAVLHPRPEIIRARPARVHLAEQAYELFCFALLRHGWSLRVVGSHGMQQSPGGATELLDVGRTV